jgi:hypothetical protein
MGMTIGATWSGYWSNKSFRVKFITGIVLLALLTPLFPVFFEYIEKREGYQLNDYLLNQLEPMNVSVLTFLIIWGMIAFTLYRCIKDPDMFLLLIWSYVLLCFGRILSIYLVPLNPPKGLIELKDPLSGIFYGSQMVTKDLFFSGHTATLFTMFLCLKDKTDKLILLLSSFAIGILVLVQHVHYTLDVAAAFLFSYLFYRMAKRLLQFDFS